MRDFKHGTRAGFQTHYRRGDTPCDECRQADRDYQALHRKRSQKYRIRNRARSRALQRLARRYPVEFRSLLIEELKAARFEAAS